MKRNEICFDARMLWHGGIGTYIRNLLPGLRASSFQLRVIVHPKMIEKERWLQAYDLILSTASIYSIKEQIEFFLHVPKVDLFFSPHYNIPLAPLRAKKRVVTIHDVFHLAYSSQLRWHERLYAKYMICQAAYRSDLIITNSRFSHEEICKYVKNVKDKIYPIHFGVDYKKFQREENEKRVQNIIQTFLLPPRYFLFVGNLKSHKNLQGLLLAMRYLPTDIKLVVIGKSEGMRYVDTGSVIYNQYPELQGRIFWFSSITNEDLPIFYQLAEALVFPSYYEGFGFPPLESMGCGCPVIASNVASLPEICSSAAIYVSPENSKEIASAMQKIVIDRELRRKLIEEGYKNIQKFSWEKSIERHIELLEKLISTTDS